MNNEIKHDESLHEDLQKIIDAVYDMKWKRMSERDLLAVGKLWGVLAILESLQKDWDGVDD